MNRTTLPLATLLLAASLASCAPTVQGPMGGYRPNVVAGVPYLLAVKVPALQITDATPDSSYATFDDCPQLAVAVGDVRKLGVEEADRVCRETKQNINVLGTAVNTGTGIVLFIAGLLGFYLLEQVLR